MEHINVDDLKKELNQAFGLVASLRVDGDAVDVVAGIRSHLRRAYRMLGEEEKEDG